MLFELYKCNQHDAAQKEWGEVYKWYTQEHMPIKKKFYGFISCVTV